MEFCHDLQAYFDVAAFTIMMHNCDFRGKGLEGVMAHWHDFQTRFPKTDANEKQVPVSIGIINAPQAKAGALLSSSTRERVLT